MSNVSVHQGLGISLNSRVDVECTQVDEIIERLLEVRNGRPGKQVQLAENEIRMLCLTAKEIFMSQPNLLELEAPIKICGESLSRKAIKGPLDLDNR